MILDVRLCYFESLGLVYYSYSLTGSFVILLAAAWFSGKLDQKVGVVNEEPPPLHNILHPPLSLYKINHYMYMYLASSDILNSP